MIEFGINRNIGGALTSLKWNGVEMLHQPGGKTWSGQDHCIFPFTGMLADGFYLHNGKKYEMKIHGLLNYMKPIVLIDLPEHKRVLFSADKETLKKYPFNFDVFVDYIPDENGITISMEVINKGNETMPFYLGWHPAIQIPFDIHGEDAVMRPISLELEGVSNYRTHKMADGRYCYEEFDEFEGNIIEMNSTDFVNGASTLLSSKGIESIVMRRKDDVLVKYELGGAPVVTIWTMEKQSNYVCVEPWWGMPDGNPLTREISEKKMILKALPGESIKKSYRISFYKK